MFPVPAAILAELIEDDGFLGAAGIPVPKINGFHVLFLELWTHKNPPVKLILEGNMNYESTIHSVSRFGNI